MLATVFSRRVRLAFFVLATFGVMAGHPTWARSIGADVWNVPAIQEEIRTSQTERDHLDAENEEICHRIAIKESIVTDLVASRITLSEATEQFTELNAARPNYMTVIRDTFRGATDQEKMARNVIAFVVTRVSPQEQTAVVGRLEAELARMLGGSAAH